jgi:hypothetical protein
MLGREEHVDELRRLIRTGPDPRVRQRAHVVLLLAEGESVLGGSSLVSDGAAPQTLVAAALGGARTRWPG